MRFAFSKPTRTDDDTRLLLTHFREVGYDGLQLKAGQYAGYLDRPEEFLADWGQQRDFAPVIDNFHLKDYAAGEWRMLGTGGIDFEPIFAAIAAIGYDGWLSTDEESDAPLLPAMEHCLAFMREHLASGRD